MKKISTILLLMALFAGTSCIAIQTINIEEQKAVNKTTSEKYLEMAKENDTTLKLEELSKRYLNNLRTCEQIHVSETIDFFGLKISFNADINGWVDNKCAYSVSGKIHSLGKDIREVYGVKATDEDLAKIEPAIKCNFSQDELNTLVDGLIAASKRNQEKIIDVSDKSGSSKYNSLSPEEQKLVQMLIAGNVCTIPNLNEIIEQYSTLLKSQE